ncbi:hypothetical protein EVAR_11326_1 [Eumeta japonica]|uniref:Uncharacterized protein n=1 Tax=Eumeta variegata TaxID=151549 RepID=A0A4C1U278_EUMVA|nr:hypothetical protein EVAR_11326_1 [Eumeta japonica]
MEKGRRRGIFRKLVPQVGLSVPVVGAASKRFRVKYKGIRLSHVSLFGVFSKLITRRSKDLMIWCLKVSPSTQKKYQGKQTCEPPDTRRSSLPMDTRNHRGVTSALKISWVGIKYIIEGIFTEGGGVMKERFGSPALSLTRRNATLKAVASPLNGGRMQFPTLFSAGAAAGNGPIFNLDLLDVNEHRNNISDAIYE